MKDNTEIEIERPEPKPDFTGDTGSECWNLTEDTTLWRRPDDRKYYLLNTRKAFFVWDVTPELAAELLSTRALLDEMIAGMVAK